MAPALQVRTVIVMDSARKYRSAELADRIASLITTAEAGEELPIGESVYRFVVLDTPSDQG